MDSNSKAKYDLCPNCFTEGRLPANHTSSMYSKTENPTYTSIVDRDAMCVASEMAGALLATDTAQYSVASPVAPIPAECSCLRAPRLCHAPSCPISRNRSRQLHSCGSPGARYSPVYLCVPDRWHCILSFEKSSVCQNSQDQHYVDGSVSLESDMSEYRMNMISCLSSPRQDRRLVAQIGQFLFGS